MLLLFIAVVNADLTPEQRVLVNGCEAGWTLFSDRCARFFSESSFILWKDAEAKCQAYPGGHLLSIHSTQENTAAYKLSRGSRAWIGMELTKSYGSFVWTDGSASNYLKFSTSSYDVRRGSGGPIALSNGYFYKYYSNSNQKYYLCQMPRLGVSNETCGDVFLNSMYGEFTSPNYPKNYDDNDKCRWEVQAPRNHTLTVTVHEFDSELHRDVLTIYTNTSSYAKFQGYYPQTPIKFLVDTDILFFLWNTDPIDNKNTGFNISYQASDCPKLWDIAEGKVTYTGIQAGEKATYTCRSGFILNGTADQTCIKGAGWSSTVPRCVRLECPRLAAPIHGNLLTLNKFGYKFEGILKLQCDVGYQVNNLNVSSLTRNCTDDGIWSGPPLTCEPVSCGPLPVTTTRALAKVYGSGTSYGTVIRTSCVYGVRKGSVERTCQANGAWSGSDVYCNEAVTCDFKYHTCGLTDMTQEGRNSWKRITTDFIPSGGDLCQRTDDFHEVASRQLNNADALSYSKTYASSSSSCTYICRQDKKCTVAVHYSRSKSCYLFGQLQKSQYSIYTSSYTTLIIRKCQDIPRVAVSRYNTARLPARLVSGQYVSSCERKLSFDYFIQNTVVDAKPSLKVIHSQVSPFIGKSTFNLLEGITGPTEKAYSKDKWTQKTIILPKFTGSDYTPQRVIFEANNGGAAEISIRSVKLDDNCYVPPTTTQTATTTKTTPVPKTSKV